MFPNFFNKNDGLAPPAEFWTDARGIFRAKTGLPTASFRGSRYENQRGVAFQLEIGGAVPSSGVPGRRHRTKGSWTSMDEKKITLIVPHNDLESHEIRRMAQSLGFFDIRLSAQPFGARLENEPAETFRDLAPEVSIVEIPGPAMEKRLREQDLKVVVIDHHEYKDLNRYRDKSSLEQFADLCGRHLTRIRKTPLEQKLTREQKLIAVNDRDYIWGMIDEGASLEQIREIRFRDLLAQGWRLSDFENNEKEYEAVREKVLKHCDEQGAVFVHETESKKTARFVELFHLPDEMQYLHYKRTRKFHPRHNLVVVRKGDGLAAEFSGSRMAREIFLDRLLPLSSHHWSGGGARFGYAGVAFGKDTTLAAVRNAIDGMRKELAKVSGTIKMPHQAPIRKFTSFFLFPFYYDTKKFPDSKLAVNEPWKGPEAFRVALKPEDLGKKAEPRDSLATGERQDETSAPENSLWPLRQNHAEYVYFHDYVRNFLFRIQDLAQDDPYSSHIKKDAVSGESQVRFYRYELDTPLVAEVRTIEDKRLAALVLDIYMHLYPCGIGVLSIETSNEPDDEDWREKIDASYRLEKRIVSDGEGLLLFHNMFRRLYPAYYEKDHIDQQMRGNEFPLSVTFRDIHGNPFNFRGMENGVGLSKDDFERTCFRKTPNSREDRKEPSKHYPTLSARYVTGLVDSFLGAQSGEDMNFSPILDDRMLVYSYVAFDGLDGFHWDDRDIDVFFSHLLYVDNPAENYRYEPGFTEALLERAGYRRWKHWKTRIGFSRYSAVFQYDGHMLFLHRSFVSMYYQMFLLVTYYRARLIRLSDKMSSLSRQIGDEKDKTLDEDLKIQFRQLRKLFVKFMNIEWFTEVTNQDQGIEIFDLMRDAFQLGPMYQDVKEEIERTDELMDLYHRDKLDRFGEMAGKAGLLVGALAILFGFLAVNHVIVGKISGTLGIVDSVIYYGLVGLLLCLAIALGTIFRTFLRKKNGD